MREDDYPSGKRSVLADALSGVQAKSAAGGDDHKGMPEMRTVFHFLFSGTAVACILSGVPGGTQVTAAGIRK